MSSPVGSADGLSADVKEVKLGASMVTNMPSLGVNHGNVILGEVAGAKQLMADVHTRTATANHDYFVRRSEGAGRGRGSIASVLGQARSSASSAHSCTEHCVRGRGGAWEEKLQRKEAEEAGK